jgi:hypothetical protein
MEWAAYLDAGERILWEGCPAPRCYCFQHWRRAVWLLAGGGLALLLWLLALPRPLAVTALAGGLWFFPGEFLWARLQWGAIFYALTDRSLVAVRGRFRPRLTRLPVGSIAAIDSVRLGRNLATVRVYGRGGERLVLCCLEYPGRLTDLLEPGQGRKTFPPRSC